MDISGREGSTKGSLHDSCSSFHDVEIQEVHSSTLSGDEPSLPSEPDEHISEQHDQLPNVEEYKASQSIASTASKRSSLKFVMMAALMIFFASIFIGLGVAIGRETGPSKSNRDDYKEIDEDPKIYDNEMPSISISSRANDVTNFLINQGWANENDVRMPNTPQWLAAKWLADEDPAHMPVAVDDEFLQRYLLATIYYALSGKTWRYDVKFLSQKSVCDWNMDLPTTKGIPTIVGVNCFGGSLVKQIFLPSANLNGELPHEIGLLPDLVYLNLFNNTISGVLPPSMQNLKGLTTLIMHDNQINGQLPDWLTSLPKLRTVNLAKNRFTGLLPAFGSMESLETLNLDSNFLFGKLDAMYGASNLKGLLLGNNEINGELTDDLFESWPKIVTLDLSDNNLRGTLPRSLTAKDGLALVDLTGNNFMGKLPSIIEEGVDLEYLALGNNQLSGVLDDRLISLTKLKHLDVSKNDFTGPMPTEYGSMTGLEYLFLAFNNFNPGPIPSEYGKLSNLVDLSLQDTNRNGKIPIEIGLMSSLTLLDLNQNQLSGEIPYSFGGLKNLRFLMLMNNKLDGALPPIMASMSSLDMVLIHGNAFTTGAQAICDAGIRPQTFIAACPTTIECQCCTKCCEIGSGDPECTNVEWFSNMDPSADHQFGRADYLFKESDIIFPAEQDEKQNFDASYTGYDSEPGSSAP